MREIQSEIPIPESKRREIFVACGKKKEVRGVAVKCDGLVRFTPGLDDRWWVGTCGKCKHNHIKKREKLNVGS